MLELYNNHYALLCDYAGSSEAQGPFGDSRPYYVQQTIIANENYLKEFANIHVDGTSLDESVFATPTVLIPDMYKNCMESDFLLALLDPESKAQDAYKDGTTTGSKQLSLGLNKPMLIESTFADIYGFSDQDSVTYQGDALYQAMKEAIAMDKDTYQSKLSHLRQHAAQVAAKSQQNLAQTIADVMKDN